MRRLNGFTILEVLVVITIIGLMMLVGSVRFREFAKRQEVVNAKRQIIADIRAAQSDATSGRKPSECTGTLTGYAFDVETSTTYRTYAICGNSVPTKQASLPSNITIAISIDPVIFRPLAQGTTMTAGQVSTITITNAGVNADTIQISQSGEIR